MPVPTAQADAPSRKNVDAAIEEKAFWEDAKRVGSAMAFEAYLKEFPKGRFASLAKANIFQLKSEREAPGKASSQQDLPKEPIKAVPNVTAKSAAIEMPSTKSRTEPEPKATKSAKVEPPKSDLPKAEKSVRKEVPVGVSKIPLKPPFPRPTYSPGDRWTFQKTEVWLNDSKPRNQAPFEITEITPSGYKARSTGTKRIQIFTLNSDGNFLSKIEEQTFVNKFFQWPLALGMAWSNDRRVRGSEGHLFTIDEKCRAASLDVVTVPAGSFQTIRIDCHGFNKPDNGPANRFELSGWYSPETKRLVKSIYKKWGPSGLLQNEVNELKEYLVK